MHVAFRRRYPEMVQNPDAFGRFVASLPRSTANTGWLCVLAFQIDDKHRWCSEYEMRVLVPLIQATGKMRAVRAAIFYYLCDVVALKNGTKNWLHFLEQTAAAHGQPLSSVEVGRWIRAFNQTIKPIEIGRNKLTHNPTHQWNDLGHFDPALASEIHRIGSPNEQKPKEELVDDILTSFRSANRMLDAAMLKLAQAAEPHVLLSSSAAHRTLEAT